MTFRGRAGLVIGAAVLAGAAAAPSAPRQVVTGPVAVYWVSAQTNSGFGAMNAGGGRPSLASIMGGMRGGNVTRMLLLQLGSSQKPTGAPAADHLPPQGLGAGPDLPLVTPVQQSAPTIREEPGAPSQYQKPRGRMLIFWGCGEHARPGQPVVIDFAKVAEGQMPPAFAQMMRGLNITPMQPPSPSRNATYGEWPNARARTSVPANGSLIGDHVVRGNYSPEIRFSLGQDQDFMPPFDLTSNAKLASGAMQLAWRPVRSAQAYAASTMGSDGNETMVMWSSSELQSLMFALPDFLRPEDIQRLVAQKALLAPATTSCAVPKEVVDAAPQSMFNLVAYGPEANFAFPARPADPKVAWNIAWQVKVRYRSATSGLLGMASPGMGDDEDAPPARPGQPKPKPAKPKAGDILKGLGLPFPG